MDKKTKIKLGAITLASIMAIVVLGSVASILLEPNSGTNPPGARPALVDERFDSGLDGWTQYSSQQALIIDGELACTDQAGIYRDVPLDSFELSFTMRFTSNTWAFRIQLWSMILSHYRAIDLAHSYGYLTWGSSGYWPVQIVTGQAYHITITDVDFATHTFSVYVGEILAKAGIPFEQACSTIDLVVFANDGAGTVFFDDITIVEG